MEPVVHGRGRKTDTLDETYLGVHEELLYARKLIPVEGIFSSLNWKLLTLMLLRLLSPSEVSLRAVYLACSCFWDETIVLLCFSFFWQDLLFILVKFVLLIGAQWTGIVTTIAIEMLKSGMVEAVICVQRYQKESTCFDSRPVSKYLSFLNLTVFCVINNFDVTLCIIVILMTDLLQDLF